MTASQQGYRAPSPAHMRRPDSGLDPQSLVAELTRQLIESETRFHVIFDGAPYGIALARVSDYRFVMVNQAFCDLLGYTREELLAAHTCMSISLDEDLEREAPLARDVQNGTRDSYRIEKRYIHKDGSVFWGMLTMVVSRNDDGSLRHAFGIVEDISERKRREQQMNAWNQVLEQRVAERTRKLEQANAALETALAERQRIEQQLFQVQKMESIGRLAGGIAHDFNNLLTAMLGSAEFALQALDETHPAADDLRDIRAAALRAADLTRRLLAFARQQPIAPRVLSINRLIEGMHPLLRRLIGEDIELALELDPAAGAVLADPVQIEQVIVNLAVNARDAMPAGGTLTIATGAAEFTQPAPLDGQSAGPEPYVRVEVRDTGIGMTPEVQRHLFEPFYTTKAPGKGTGLGLATSYGIIAQHQGAIAVASEPGQGTTFRIFLPRSAQGDAAPGTPEPAPLAATGHETILLVEDEPGVREMAARVLRRQGYTVLAAADAAEALECYAGVDGRVHLLLTDVVMPRMSGLALAQQLLAAQPNLRVVFMSGYGDQSSDGDHRALNRYVSIAKPFHPDILTSTVRDALNNPQPNRN